ncbi:MAG: hypothetical protein JW953_23560 [Anaerolineae bacterium]|nr:hypothetical protein [Anaerolineae bacterium]
MEHLQMRNSNHKQRPSQRRAYPELVVAPPLSEKDAAYYAALKLVARIDEDLSLGIRHYRNRAGRLLTTLDQVVHAILADDLLVAEEQEAELMWLPQELAA